MQYLLLIFCGLVAFVFFKNKREKTPDTSIDAIAAYAPYVNADIPKAETSERGAKALDYLVTAMSGSVTLINQNIFGGEAHIDLWYNESWYPVPGNPFIDAGQQGVIDIGTGSQGSYRAYLVNSGSGDILTPFVYFTH